MVAKFLRGIQAWAPVAAEFAVIIKTHAGDQQGAGQDFDIIFEVQGAEFCAVFGAASGRIAGDIADGDAAGIGDLHRGRIVELLTVPLCPQGHGLFEPQVERQRHFTGGSDIFQPTGVELVAVDHPFDTPGRAFLKTGIVGFFVVNADA
ncbi:hypothetical protein D3C78_1240040 [compost metagenome]